MIFQCNTGKTVGKKTWTGDIRLLVHTSFHYEAVITARGTSFHVIAGKYRNGNYLCVPNMDFGCELSTFQIPFGMLRGSGSISTIRSMWKVLSVE